MQLSMGVGTQLPEHSLLCILPCQAHDTLNAGGLKQIVAEEGVRGLYRGLGPQFVALLPNWAVRVPSLLALCLPELHADVSGSNQGHNISEIQHSA